MIRMPIILLIFVSLSFSTDLLQYVDPMIGTGAADTPSAEKHGSGTESFAQTFPAVGKPFAMTFWTPETRPTEKKCVSPYYYSDTRITGFRGSHWTSGSCVQDYGTFTLMPSSELVCLPEERATVYQHTREKSTPAYYSVHLDDYDIDVELTGTDRCGMMNFTFHTDDGYVIVNSNSERGESFMQILPETNEIVGYNPVHRIYQGWGEPAGFSGYVVIQFQQPFAEFGTFAGPESSSGKMLIENEPESGVFVKFDAAQAQTIRVKIGTSFTSIEQARKNVNAEIPHWNFAGVKQETENAWNEMMNRLEVEGGTPEELKKYYTAVYHCMLAPHKFSDVDGSFVGFADNNEVHKAEGFTYYTDFSMWDIFRAELPLINMIAPELSLDFIKSITVMAEHGGWMPIFPMWNHYTSAMIGDHIVSFIADAWAKGIRDFDLEKLYPYLRQNAFETPENFQDYVDGKGRRALSSYLKYGYIPMEDPVKEAFHQNEQVSRTLEYAYDDFCLAQLAKALDKTKDYEILMQRSENWRHVFDPQVNWVRGKHENGEWAKDFKSDEKQIYITEGTPRHYTWYVPQNVLGLVEAMGGADVFERKLDDMFAGGYYWHGNEPGHQIPFLYTFIDKPEKTRAIVEKIMKEEYGLGPGGLSGNDDAGQMSAWYVFAAIGKYPVCPGVDAFAEYEPFLKLK